MRETKQRWRPSPLVVVSTTAAGVLAFLLALNWVAARRQRVNAHVEIADPVLETAAAARAAPGAPVRGLPDGEVERTAARVRDVSALALGLTLLAVNEGLSRRTIINVENLVSRFAARSLLPPGVRQNPTPGVLESERALLYVRYRPEPLAVEVLSVGRDRLDGPSLIGRIATGAEEEAGASLFIAHGLGDVPLPAAFTPAARMAALNWTAEPLRERAFTSQEAGQINNWLRAQSGELGSP